MSDRTFELAACNTYNPNDSTSVGYHVEVFNTGRVRLTTRNRWQGAEDGAVFTSTASDELKAAAQREAMGVQHLLEPDFDCAVEEWLASAPPLRKIRKGSINR